MLRYGKVQRLCILHENSMKTCRKVTPWKWRCDMTQFAKGPEISSKKWVHSLELPKTLIGSFIKGNMLPSINNRHFIADIGIPVYQAVRWKGQDSRRHRHFATERVGRFGKRKTRLWQIQLNRRGATWKIPRSVFAIVNGADSTWPLQVINGAITPLNGLIIRL